MAHTGHTCLCNMVFEVTSKQPLKCAAVYLRSLTQRLQEQTGRNQWHPLMWIFLADIFLDLPIWTCGNEVKMSAEFTSTISFLRLLRVK